MRVRSKLSSKEPNSIFRSTIAIALVFICVYAANWQYERGVVRHAKNFKIESNTQLPKIALSEIRDLAQNEWRTVTVTGEFDRTHEVLLRNRYSETGVYGFEYLTLFKSNEDQFQQFWVDRGWIKAGERATDRPDLPATPDGEITLTGRLRLNTSLPRGSFFALPANSGPVTSWNLKSKVQTEEFYLDLIAGEGVTPAAPAELPELSDGPHMAYALQWLFFAGLVIYGRLLIRKR